MWVSCSAPGRVAGTRTTDVLGCCVPGAVSPGRSGPERPGRSEPERPSLAEPFVPLLAVAGMLAVMWASRSSICCPAPISTAGGSGRARCAGSPASRWRRSCTPASRTSSPTPSRSRCSARSSPSGPQRFVEVTVIVAVTSGLGTWLFGSPGTIHIGASGLVFGYLAYLVARGFFAAKPLWVLGGVIVRCSTAACCGACCPARGSRSPATCSAPPEASSPRGTSTAATRRRRPPGLIRSSTCGRPSTSGASDPGSRTRAARRARTVRAVGGAGGGRAS